MRVVKVFNNNVALARDEAGREIVVQGRGLAFQARSGDRLNPALIERRFVPESSDKPEQFAQMVADIPPEIIVVAEEILGLGLEFDLQLDHRAVVALADHISIALRRLASGQSFAHPLEWEVRLLYVREAKLGARALDLIHGRTGIRLPAAEAVPLALHFVNAQVGAGRIGEAVRSARIIRDIITVIEGEYGVVFDGSNALASARFATHLRYLFLSHLAGDGRGPLIAELAKSFQEQDPRAYACARHITSYISNKMGWNINDDETTYIAIHIQRMTYNLR